MPFYLAIDAGGTGTRCLVADDTRVLGRASNGTVKLMRVSELEATARLQSMLTEVLAAGGVSPGEVRRTCFGLAGVSNPAVQAWARQSIATIVGGDLILCGDEEIALDAAFLGGSGILVIAGTGSNAIGRSASGEIFGAGGWGPVLGDEGSGYWIGLESIRSALRARDSIGVGGRPTGLLGEIERHWNLNSVAELVAVANQRVGLEGSAPDFASLAPVVFRCAEQGDWLAQGILERAGEELAELVSLVFHKVSAAAGSYSIAAGPASDETAPIGVAFTGGVLSHIAPVRSAMIARLAVSVPTARVHDTAVDPLDGALWRARHV